MARSLAASEAPKSAWPYGISMAAAVHDTNTIIAIKLRPYQRPSPLRTTVNE